jgi:membrane protein involved in colicin uptake
LAKAKADQEAKVKAEEDRKKQALAEKARQDSLTAATKALKDKEEADRKAKITADIQAQKDALAKANTYEKTSANKAPTTAVPKIVASDYQEGITDEKITEVNRSIQRTVVKKDGVTTNYQKITYNWGGVFYFKNESSITQTTFDTELSQAKKSFNK